MSQLKESLATQAPGRSKRLSASPGSGDAARERLARAG